ncbi:helix-turn-helix domain-containing protein [Pseudomonas sp. B10(2017)]|uniref:helix-turn-helix domain-containing protein n=1 Tax=Pseudomonas sp. B10(2017) TaxID=1981749 RepID=UPI000A1DEE3A|nr:helix-turn-helix domain-containing protein [Pseudomonas sp. B10(2017)]
MSVQAMTWALEQQEVGEPHARHVLLCLANYADQDGRAAFPSVARLAVDTGLSPRTVQYRLRDLEQKGAIRRGNQAIPAAYITQRDRIPVCYDIAMDRGAQHAPGARQDVPGCTPEHNGVHATTERGAQHAPEPSLNHQLTTHNRKEGDDAAAGGKGKRKTKQSFDPLTAKPENCSDRAWADFCEMRKAKRAPLTERACELIAKKLEGHRNADAVLDKSTVSCWTDVYPEATANAGARPGRPGAFNNLPQHTDDMYQESHDGRSNF